RSGPLGRGWTHNYNRYLSVEQPQTPTSTGRAVVYDGTGRRHGFRFFTIEYWYAVCDDQNPPNCGSFHYCQTIVERPFGRTFDLGFSTCEAPPHATATFPNGELWTFSNSSGGPIAGIRDPRGGYTTFSYNASGKLSA